MDAKGDGAAAIADYSKAIEIDPRSLQTYVNRGNARYRKGDKAGAIADYNKAIEIDPRQPKAYNNRASMREENGDLDGALADYTQAIEIDARYSKAYHLRGNLKKKKGDAEGALADFLKAIETDSRNAQAHNALAWLLATATTDKLRDGKMAVEHAQKAAELTTWQDPNILDTLAAAYAETGNFEEAIKWQNKALSFPEYAKGHGEEAGQHLQLYTERKPYREK
jgi:tetratricopeptide (TPR) repeat protein